MMVDMLGTLDTLGHRFQERANALNAIRLVLAASVIVWHAYAFALRDFLPDSGVRLLEQVGVDGFFAISGFLIVRSWQQHPYPFGFLRARAARILPGLWACLIATAFVIVPVAAGLAGHVRPSLLAQSEYVLSNVGVYMLAPSIDGVSPPGGWLVWNPSLWTLWWELVAYLAVLAAGLTGLLTTRGVAGFAVWCWVASLGTTLLGSEATDASTHWNTAIPRLGLMFACGALLWMLRNRIPVSGLLLAGSGAVIAAGSLIPNYRLLAAPAVAYLCVTSAAYLGRWSIFRPKQDFSYGVYVYGAPVQLGLIGVGFVGSWFSFVAATLAFVLPLAAASWFLVERPAIRWARRRRSATAVNSDLIESTKLSPPRAAE